MKDYRNYIVYNFEKKIVLCTKTPGVFEERQFEKLKFFDGLVWSIRRANRKNKTAETKF